MEQYQSLALLLMCSLCSWLYFGEAREVKVVEKGHGNVFVVDGAVSSSHVEKLNDFLTGHAPWDFDYVEAGDAAGKHTNPWNFHWVVPLPVSFTQNLRALKVAQQIVHVLTNGSDYVPADGFGTLSKFGDAPKIFEGSSENPKDFLVVLHLSDYKGNRTCSELLFYNEQKEVIGTVPSASGRIVAWLSGVGHFLRPPCSGSFIAGRLLFFHFKPKKEQVESVSSSPLELQQLKADLVGLPPSEPHQMGIGQYLTRKFHDSKGRVISIFDGLFSTEELTQIRKLVLQPGGFSFKDHQTDESDDYDNVSWMSGFKVESILRTKVWNIVAEMAYFLSGERGWYPYDVSNNVIERSFHTRIHEDCEGEEHEYTFLLYLNPSWNENMYGETIFVEQVGDKVDRKDYETIGAVKPKFGRICMFRNIISHSARPPSPDFEGARFTFAIKISRNKKIGISKMFREALEDEENEENVQLKEQLHLATIGGKDLDITEEQLERNFESFIEKKSAQYRQNQLETLNKLGSFE